MGNGFRLVKLSNFMDRNKVLQGQPWFVEGQIYVLKNRKKKKKEIDPVKEKLQILFFYGFVCLAYLWKCGMIGFWDVFLVPWQINQNRSQKSEEVSKGAVAHVYVEVNVIKPLKRKLKYVHQGLFYEWFLD